MTKRQENKEKKQTAILSAALNVFSEKGFASAKMIDIAKAAGVGKGTLYEYHQSKEELFFNLFDWYINQMTTASMVNAERLSGNAEDRLRALLNSIINAFYQEIDVFSLFLEFWAAAGNPKMRDRFRVRLLGLYDRMRTVIETLVDEGKQNGLFRKDMDTFSIAAGLIGAIDGMMLQAWMARDFDILSASNNYLETLIQGMRH